MKNIMTIKTPSTQKTTDTESKLSNDKATELETHPFEPVLPPNATVMMMGTFPPTADKWAMSFHYPNFYNDMWRIYGRVFFDDADYFRIGDEKRFDPERIRDFMFERGIASCPTVKQAIRETGNASDKNLTVVTPVDLEVILPQVPKVKSLFTTGGKATEVLLGLLDEPIAKSKHPKTNQSMDYPYQWQSKDNQKADVNNLILYRLPSTSRAYPLSLDKKVAAYKSFFEKMGKL
ncbi:DNA glycosylase [Psychrobacter sp. Choline-02u-13]|jgi:G:T/U-mismatch repair DNA glycosylase|nr:DNA glycosylase [Psychrobacter sp. Urea-trap-18]MBA6284868.1 DNA glycosylase [Psychrobacter sp. Urea-trap-16]MBA6317328.1 DNA glycosylase [Psychrobacter sp. Urea-trap-20]MBA6334933.1 DNA glycosylase [Psychrobacter sp. Urea-trap-19]PKG61072.1 DNA glycosylase [Psychrobacter sp. Choline-3u-12]PKG67352.1 DNA glycosylase [Psychrobacter sp. Choline-02u-13]PKH48984.1 DNA glycosylase [Psychrobacter sp. Choline-02u-9]TEW83500.1 DNA glycosylase [Psychrobacter sp. 230]|tara:strand:- start:289 stop:990 length:702 start_codon:yes stop_codon:yes gene_type:complete